MRINYNSSAEEIIHQQQVCDKSDILLLVTGSTELLVGNIATYAMLTESPTVGSALRWGGVLLLSTLCTVGSFAGRNHEYDVLDGLRDPVSELPMARQQG